jgi:hypothetical protein
MGAEDSRVRVDRGQPGMGAAGAASRSSKCLFIPVLIPPSRPALEPGRTSWTLLP